MKFKAFLIRLIVAIMGTSFDRPGDFKKYYDTELKRSYWVLGYFGGGSIKISEIIPIIAAYAKENGVPFEKVYVDEILASRRFKGFKFISTTEKMENVGVGEVTEMEKVYAWLRD